MTNVTVSARWSPYAVNDNFRPINTFYWDTNKRPLRFVNLTVRTSTNFTIKQLRQLFTGKKATPTESTPFDPESEGLDGNNPPARSWVGNVVDSEGEILHLEIMAQEDS